MGRVNSDEFATTVLMIEASWKVHVNVGVLLLPRVGIF